MARRGRRRAAAAAGRPRPGHRAARPDAGRGGGLGQRGARAASRCPTALEQLGYALIGVRVGLRFTRASLRSIARLLPLATALIVLVIVACALLGLLLSEVTGRRPAHGVPRHHPGRPVRGAGHRRGQRVGRDLRARGPGDPGVRDAAGRAAARPPAGSVEAELVALGVLHDDVAGAHRRTGLEPLAPGVAPSATSRSHSASSAAIRLVALQPGRGAGRRGARGSWRSCPRAPAGRTAAGRPRPGRPTRGACRCAGPPGRPRRRAPRPRWRTRRAAARRR